MTSQLSGWLGCTPWRAWLMTGRKTGRPALMCCVPICACHTSPILAWMLPGRNDLPSRPSVKSATPSSGSSPRTSREDAAMSWQGLNFDFTGVVFDGGDFSDARFSGGIVDFSDARFSSGTVDFSLAQFSGGTVDFGDAKFSGGDVDFSDAKFSGGGQLLQRPVLRRHGRLQRAEFSGGDGRLQQRPVLRRRRSTSATPSSPAARSASATPSSPAARSASPSPGSPAARSTSAAPSSPAASSTSATPGSPAAGRLQRRSVLRRRVGFDSARFSGGTVDFSALSSPAATSTSATLATGHSRPRSTGRTHRLQA